MTEVLFKFVSGDTNASDSSLEPQFVRIRSNNTADTYIVSYTGTPAYYTYTPGTNPSFLPFNPYNIMVNATNSFVNRFKRIALVGVRIKYAIPNINIMNNILVFNYNNIIYTATIEIGFYQTVPDLFLGTNGDSDLNGIVYALNQAVGSNVFTWTPDPLNPLMGMLDAAESYYFILDQGGFMRGTQTYNLPWDQSAITSKTTGPSYLQYNAYWNIYCQELIQYSKLYNSSNDITTSSGFLGRIPITSYMASHPGYYDLHTNDVVWINWEPAQKISTLTFRTSNNYNDDLQILEFPQATHSYSNTFFEWQFLIET